MAYLMNTFPAFLVNTSYYLHLVCEEVWASNSSGETEMRDPVGLSSKDLWANPCAMSATFYFEQCHPPTGRVGFNIIQNLMPTTGFGIICHLAIELGIRRLKVVS